MAFRGPISGIWRAAGRAFFLATAGLRTAARIFLSRTTPRISGAACLSRWTCNTSTTRAITATAARWLSPACVSTSNSERGQISARRWRMFQKDLLKGRAVFITGGGTGLGRSMSLRLAELGAKMFLAGRREEPLRETSQAIRRAGGECGFASCDVRDPAAVETAIAAAEKQLGRVDRLINNAAGHFIARTEKLSPNAFHALVGIVLYGTFHCTTAFGRRWLASGQPGTVLNIATTYAAVDCCGSGFVVPSTCAKAGVLAMTRSLAVEGERYRIRLNAIAPGPFPTEGAFSRLMRSEEYE